jgi:PAS domain S-box-containing protein
MKRASPRSDELRRRAERRITDKRASGDADPTGIDALKLLHELQVHQVELEMQNASLREARAQEEAALQKYTDLYDFAPVGYFTLDGHGRIVECNLTGAALLEAERSALIGRRFQMVVTPKDRPAFSAFLAGLFLKPGRKVWETRLVGDRGATFWADIHASSRETAASAEARCQIVVSNISALKRAEQAQRRVEQLTATNEEANREIARRRALEASLRQSERKQRALLAETKILHVQVRYLARHILLAQEKERKAISRELHDHIAQVLAGINVHLGALTTGGVLRDRNSRLLVDKFRRVVGQAIEVVRRFARELRPSVLDDLGLIPALTAHVNELSERTGLRIHLTMFSEVEALDVPSKTVLYRVAQEALTNVVRHAQAGNVSLRLRKLKDRVRLEVHDDGKAFDAARVLARMRRDRLGVLGMRERVEMMEGRFAIESAPGEGTTVIAELPWYFDAPAKS